MGFFDKVKKKAQEAAGQFQGAPMAQAVEAPSPSHTGQPAPQPAGPSFVWDGDSYPLPQGWDGMSIDDWFFKFETVRERMMHIDDERGLQPMTDEDGGPLDPEEVLLITEYGFRDGGHFEAYRNFAVYQWAQQTGESPTNCEFRMGGIARERIMASKAGAMSGAGGALEPVEGVSVESWAQIQAQIAGGADANALVANAGIEPDRWQRVSAEWNARMSTDTTATIANVYSQAFAGAAVGQYGAAAAQASSAGIGGDVGAEPAPFETFVEVTEALNAGSAQGQDPGQTLASFGMSPVDWSNLGMYWNKKLAQNAEHYSRLFDEYSAKYAAKYGNGDGLTTEQREKKILAQVMDMARTGQASQILPFLQNYFPDDANDKDALDWWLDTACDRCGESGDQACAQQLLPIRYQLQDDVEESLNEWVASEMESLF